MTHRDHLDEDIDHLEHPREGRVEIRAALGLEGVAGHVVQKGVRLSPAGASEWQEVAVVTESRLLLWMSRSVAEQPEGSEGRRVGATYETDLRVIPLSAVREVSVRTAYRESGEPAAISVLAQLGSVDVADNRRDSARFVYDSVHFASGQEDDAGSVGRIQNFGQVLSNSVTGRELGEHQHEGHQATRKADLEETTA